MSSTTDGMTTGAEESQDTPEASLADTQESQDTSAAGKPNTGKRKKAKAKLPIFTGLPPMISRLNRLFVDCGRSCIFLSVQQRLSLFRLSMQCLASNLLPSLV